MGSCEEKIIITAMAIKLVIVDDAPFIREVLRHSLSGPEFEIVGEAQDGEEALEVVRKTRPNVVLMDIVMPRKSGIDATKEIRAEFPEVRVIACSTLDQEAIVMRALEAGCTNYIIKPFKRDEVIQAVKSAALNPNQGQQDV